MKSFHAKQAGLQGFTLLELLATVSIIAVLAGLATAGIQSGLQTAKKTKEIGAARNLITAYQTATSENDGRLLPGYDRTVTSLPQPDGTVINALTAHRYPFRLVPYLNYQLEGSILVNDNADQLHAERSSNSLNNYRYLVSVSPALGMNYYFVGGNIAANGTVSYPNDCVRTIGQGSSSILVFASAAGSGAPGVRMKGYSILTPPHLTGNNWSTAGWTKDSDPASYGQVEFRYGGDAICAFLDGSVRALPLSELRDMRLWNANALAANDPHYFVSQ